MLNKKPAHLSNGAPERIHEAGNRRSGEALQAGWFRMRELLLLPLKTCANHGLWSKH